ncbi:MAG: serine/threonine-protein kinase [Candidatus Promineifilaceae bacterium]
MLPEKIGRYEIEKELGRGGMAVVYLAMDPFMSREVAIKVLPRQFTFDPQFRARFQREAQVIAKLDHPAIVPVYDFGEHEEQPFIVMRYMKGGSLADRLKENGPIPVPQAAEILKRIGSALDEAHQKGIVHRDLKPGNILFDDRGDAFVADFGIVKMSEATIQYTGNAIIGTPGYMSPEQARGEEEVDGRSDIYSLGAIAYEMLTGKLPYQSDTPMGLVMKHILEPVPNLLVDRPDLPSNTATVISKAMAKEPNQRFQSCVDIASALSDSATVQMQGGAQQATVLESPVMPTTGMAGTVVETPSYHPRPQTVPPTTGGAATGYPPTGPGSASDIGIGTYTAEPEKKRGGIPNWIWAVGCLGIVLCIGGAVALGGLGVLGNILNKATPTSAVVVNSTATPQATLEIATATAALVDAATATSAPLEPTNTPNFNLNPTDTPGASNPGGGAISLGSTLNGSVGDGETQNWTFNAAAGDRIDVVVQPDSEDFDLVFDIFNEEGDSVVPGGEIDESFGTEEIRNLTIPAPGAYTIAVTGFAGTAGSYTVSLDTAAEAPPGSTLYASDTLTSGAEHLFPFASSSGGVTVVAIVQPESDLDVVLSIYNDDTDALLEDVDDSFGRETLSYQLPAAGNYYFSVTGYDNSTGNYDITLFVPPEASLLLAHQDHIDASFGSTTQLDYYFRGDAGEIFTVSASPLDNIDLVIEIFADGDLLTPLAEADDNLSGEAEELTFTLPDDNLYVIRVREFFNDLGSFTVDID